MGSVRVTKTEFWCHLFLRTSDFYLVRGDGKKCPRYTASIELIQPIDWPDLYPWHTPKKLVQVDLHRKLARLACTFFLYKFHARNSSLRSLCKSLHELPSKFDARDFRRCLEQVSGVCVMGVTSRLVWIDSMITCEHVMD